MRDWKLLGKWGHREDQSSFVLSDDRDLSLIHRAVPLSSCHQMKHMCGEQARRGRWRDAVHVPVMVWWSIRCSFQIDLLKAKHLKAGSCGELVTLVCFDGFGWVVGDQLRPANHFRLLVLYSRACAGFSVLHKNAGLAAKLDSIIGWFWMSSHQKNTVLWCFKKCEGCENFRSWPLIPHSREKRFFLTQSGVGPYYFPSAMMWPIIAAMTVIMNPDLKAALLSSGPAARTRKVPWNAVAPAHHTSLSELRTPPPAFPNQTSLSWNVSSTWSQKHVPPHITLSDSSELVLFWIGFTSR